MWVCAQPSSWRPPANQVPSRMAAQSKRRLPAGALGSATAAARLVAPCVIAMRCPFREARGLPSGGGYVVEQVHLSAYAPRARGERPSNREMTGLDVGRPIGAIV